MKMTITIDTANAAFDPPDTGAELARILHDAARKLDCCVHQRTEGFRLNLYDVNGNHVGHISTTEKEPKP